jgi:hypothetical protein
MNEGLEKSKIDIKERLLALIKIYPQIIQPEMEAETFVEELNIACAKMFESNDNDIFNIEMMARVIDGIPQLLKPGIGIEAFVEGLLKAAAKYIEYFRDERRIC